MITKVKREIKIEIRLENGTEADAFSTTKDFLEKVQIIFCDEHDCDQCPFGCGSNKACSLDKVRTVLTNGYSNAKFYTN